MSKKILVITASKLPFGGNGVVNGGGARSWSIAETLRRTFTETFIALPKDFGDGAPEWCLPYENLDDLFSLATQFDVIIASYSQWLIPNLFPLLPNNILKIADGYTPAHMEFLARDSELTDFEVDAFRRETDGWHRALTSCDALLVTSKEQELYYSGMLFALGKVDPKNYRATPTILAPFGINPEEDIAKAANAKGLQRTLLWYGGFYPWFDFQSLPEICRQLLEKNPNIKVLVAGARNPDISEKSFSEPASRVISDLETLSNVEFLPWADYDDRFDAFENVDGVIALNRLGPETKLSWRLRYTDIASMSKPLFTNGGDPFGEEIIANGAGLRLQGQIGDYSSQIEQALYSKNLFGIAKSMQIYASKITWDACYEELVGYVTQSNPATFSINSEHRKGKSPISERLNTARTLITAFKHLAKERGLLLALVKAFSFIFQKITEQKARLQPPLKLEGNLVFFHQLEFSGAPKVGLEIIEALKANRPDTHLTLVVPKVVDQGLIQKLNSLKVKVEVLSPNQKLALGNVQSVFVNSSATPWGWIRDASFHWQEAETKYPFVFFNHEQDPETYLDKRKTLHLKELAKQGLVILVPSRKTQEHLRQLHEVGLDSKIVKLKITAVPSKPVNTKLDTIDIILVGQTFDGRKKHGEILASVLLAQQKAERLENARQINLSFVGVGDDPIGIEVLRMGNLLMKPSTFKSSGRVSFSDCSKLMGEANVVVSMNARESFALYVGETMTGGAVVLRNEAGGTAETLQNGKNGFKIQDSIEDLAEKILFLADKDKCPNQMLESMMLESKNQVKPYVETNYEEVISLLSQNGY